MQGVGWKLIEGYFRYPQSFGGRYGISLKMGINSGINVYLAGMWLFAVLKFKVKRTRPYMGWLYVL
jgi:hypothetical protein